MQCQLQKGVCLCQARLQAIPVHSSTAYTVMPLPSMHIALSTSNAAYLPAYCGHEDNAAMKVHTPLPVVAWRNCK